jgi:hypothetical protein
MLFIRLDLEGRGKVLFLRKLLSALKHYWYFPVVLIAFVVLAVVLRRIPSNLANVLSSAVEAHKAEVKVLEDTHAEEITKRNRALELYHAAIEKVEEKFRIDSIELDSKKRKDIKKIVEENQDDTEALAARISEYTGFEIVMPL